MSITAEVIKSECPYCQEHTNIGRMETTNLHILQCGLCQKVWMVLHGKRDRMIRMKFAPETFEENKLCPVCWRILRTNYDQWVVECLDPTCGYSKRLPGLSKEQREIKRRYLEFRDSVFAKDEVSEKDAEELSRLREAYNSIKKYDIYDD